jgi:TolA-binding protein
MGTRWILVKGRAPVVSRLRFSITIGALLLSSAVVLAGEPAKPETPFEKAKRLSASKGKKDRIQALRWLKALARPGTTSGDEATFRYAELCLRFHNEGEKTALGKAKASFEALRTGSGSRYGVRGMLGVLRVLAAEGKRDKAIKGLDRFLGQQTKCERAVECAYYLASVHCQKREDIQSLRRAQAALGYALKLHAAVSKYHRPLIGTKAIKSKLAWVKRRIWEIEAGRLKVLFEKAEKLRKTRKYGEAIKVYRQIRKEFPAHDLTELSGLRIGQCLNAIGKFKDARTFLEGFVKQLPLGAYRGQAHLLLGDIWLEQEFRAACAEVEYSAVLHPDKYKTPVPGRVPGFWTPNLNAKLLRVRPDKRVAEKDPLAAEAKASRDPAKCRMLVKSDMPEGAHRTWASAIPDAHIRLGIVTYMRAEFKGADKHFSRSFMMRPDVRFGKGLPAGMLLLAEKCRKRELPVPAYVLRTGGDRPRVCLFLAGVYLEGYKPRKAMKLYQRIISGDLSRESHPEQKAYATREKGEAFWRTRDGDKARAAWLKFTKLPMSRTLAAPRALLKLACTTYSKTRDPKALKLLETVYTAYPQSEAAPLAMYQHAGVLLAKEPMQAISLARRLKSRYPDSVHVAQVPGFIMRRAR